MTTSPVDSNVLRHLTEFDTPTICNALELVLGGRRATGFTTTQMVCAFPDLKPIVGYARTATIRAAQPSSMSPADGKALRINYYSHVSSGDGPNIAVIQDLDPDPGVGAFWGEVNTAVHKGLGVLGCVTNGSIRDLDAIAPDFQLIAGEIGPSHAFVHLEAVGVDVNIFGMPVKDGDLIHADRHGAAVIPLEVAAQMPAAIELGARKEAVVLEAARAPGFTVEKLQAAWGGAEDIH
ncbi:MAG: RraA family protein [Pseudomonadota bacterium]